MKQKVFVRLLVRFFFVIFIATLLTGVLTYALTSKQVASDTYAHTIEILDQSRSLAETTLQQIELTSYTIALNSDVGDCLSDRWIIEEDFPTLIRVNDLFIDKTHSSSFVHSVWMYSAANDKVISDSGVIELDLHRDKATIVQFINGPAASEWINTRRINRLVNPANVISLLIKLPLSTQSPRGALIINVVEDFLSDTMVGKKSGTLGEIYIVDRKGTILSNIHKDLLFTKFEFFPEEQEELEGEGHYVVPSDAGDNFVSYVTSDYNDWVYMAVSPYRTIMRASKLILFVCLIVSGCSFVVGLVLSFLVSRGYYRPIKDIVNVLAAYSQIEASNASTTNIDEIEFIDDSLKKLLVENRAFETRYRENQGVLKEHFLFNLLLGRETDEKLILMQCGHFGISFQYGYFVVMILRLVDVAGMANDELKERSLITYGLSIKAREIIARYCGGHVLIRAWDEVVILINPNNEQKIESVASMSKKIVEAIRTSLGDAVADSLFAGIGDAYDELTEIRHSYSEALDALNYQGVAGDGHTIHISDIARGKRGGSRSVLAFEVKKNQIVTALKAGNAANAEHEMRFTLAALYNDHAISIMQRKAFLIDLANSIVNAVAGRVGDIDDMFGERVAPLFELDKKGTEEDITRWFGDLLDRSSAVMGEPTRSSSKDIIESAKHYMEQHYTEQVDLAKISELTRLNARYFCRVFKEDTGRTYFEYLTEQRMKAASALLANTDKPIHIVAEETGFLNKKNIARAFRKYRNMTPTEYRAQNVVSNLTYPAPKGINA